MYRELPAASRPHSPSIGGSRAASCPETQGRQAEAIGSHRETHQREAAGRSGEATSSLRCPHETGHRCPPPGEQAHPLPAAQSPRSAYHRPTRALCAEARDMPTLTATMPGGVSRLLITSGAAPMPTIPDHDPQLLQTAQLLQEAGRVRRARERQQVAAVEWAGTVGVGTELLLQEARSARVEQWARAHGYQLPAEAAALVHIAVYLCADCETLGSSPVITRGCVCGCAPHVRAHEYTREEGQRIQGRPIHRRCVDEGGAGWVVYVHAPDGTPWTMGQGDTEAAAWADYREHWQAAVWTDTYPAAPHHDEAIERSERVTPSAGADASQTQALTMAVPLACAAQLGTVSEDYHETTAAPGEQSYRQARIEDDSGRLVGLLQWVPGHAETCPSCGAAQHLLCVCSQMLPVMPVEDWTVLSVMGSHSHDLAHQAAVCAGAYSWGGACTCGIYGDERPTSAPRCPQHPRGPDCDWDEDCGDLPF